MEIPAGFSLISISNPPVIAFVSIISADAQKEKSLSGKAGKKDKKPIDKETNSSYSDVNEPRAKLNPTEQTIADLIGDREWLVDDIIAEAGIPAPQVLAALTMLEVKKIVKTLPGRRVAGKQRK
jgi:predicted Rossmann fold nucleotide-binding protein DprA/Smf involved in DNA uptake